MKRMLMIAVVFLVASSAVSARDTTVRLDAKDVIDQSYSQGKLDPSMHFYFGDQATPTVVGKMGEGTTSRKTNAVGKTDADACKWAMLTALMALQAQAKSLGANAVIGITSNYNQQAFSSATQYECHAGGIMAGVALKGTYAKVSAH